MRHGVSHDDRCRDLGQEICILSRCGLWGHSVPLEVTPVGMMQGLERPRRGHPRCLRGEASLGAWGALQTTCTRYVRHVLGPPKALI
jgi:hypothetical protein